MDRAEIARSVDSTLLAADASAGQIEALAREAVALGCAAVCVNPVHVERAFRTIEGSPVRVASVAGFPLGASPSSAKIEECRFALARGAREVDIVIPIWACVDGRLEIVERELREILDATSGATRKLIIEMGLLPPGALAGLITTLNRLQPEFVKTGTGYSRPVTPDDVATLRGLLDPAISIKAAGGIRTRAQAEALILAGAARIGTSRAATILAG